MAHFLIRCGPSPDNTTDADGSINSVFTECFVESIDAQMFSAMLGVDGSGFDGSDPQALIRYAAAVWRRATANGYGHILIGAFSDFENVPDPHNRPSCGSIHSFRDPGRISNNYVPLYAVARAYNFDNARDGSDHIDLGIDYRGSDGPGDPNIRPVLFVMGEDDGEFDLVLNSFT